VCFLTGVVWRHHIVEPGSFERPGGLTCSPGSRMAETSAFTSVPIAQAHKAHEVSKPADTRKDPVDSVRHDFRGDLFVAT